MQNFNQFATQQGWPNVGINQSPTNYFQQTQNIPNNYISSPVNISRNSNSLQGRIVQNPEEITPNEVPMDGTISFFPKNDFSRIYAKVWTPDGTIRTFEFTPVINEGAPNLENNADISLILKKLEKIERTLYKRHNRKFDKSEERVKKDE